MLAGLQAAWMRWAAPLFGRRPRGGAARTLFHPGLFLPLALFPLALGCAAYLLITVVVDPYDLRPWGLPPRIAAHRYPDTEWPLLLKVVTAGDYDTVMVGASTVMGATPAEMKHAFPDSRPINLSYPLAAPRDTLKTLDAVAAMPRLKRVILVVDHSQMLPMQVSAPPALMRDSVMASSWAHAGDFSAQTAQGSLNRLTRGVYDQPAWAAMERPGFMGPESVVSDPRALRRFRAAMVRHRAGVLGAPESSDCGRYPFFAEVLTPALRRLTARGVVVDILFPPYPIVAYYDWIDRRLYNDSFKPGPVFPQLVELKRCAVQAAAPFGDRVHVTAVDNDLSITNDLDNFADAVHLLRPAAYQAVLDHVARGDARIDLGNFDAYRQALSRNILDLPDHPPQALVDAPVQGRTATVKPS